MLVRRVIFFNPVFVIPAGDIPHPILIFEIPLDGFADACLEAFGRLPTEFAVDFCGVDGVAAVMAGAVCDEGDLLLVELAIGAWREFVEECANGVHDIKVRFFIPTADVVGLPHPASLQHAADGGTVVAHIEPVADLLAVAVIRFLSVSSCQIKNIPWNPRLLYLVKKMWFIAGQDWDGKGKKGKF